MFILNLKKFYLIIISLFCNINIIYLILELIYVFMQFDK